MVIGLIYITSSWLVEDVTVAIIDKENKFQHSATTPIMKWPFTPDNTLQWTLHRVNTLGYIVYL